jgi:drug/metabolite transporter (DMT)-like permease
MTRLRADFLLLVAALIWGFAFVAQKDALLYIGPLAFVAGRFLLSFLVVLPLALRERRNTARDKVENKNILPLLAALCTAFTGGVILQQTGMLTTSVTNAGFLTGLYVVFVPLLCFAFFRQKILTVIIPAVLLCVAGTYLLSGGGDTFGWGDAQILLCAVFFALHVVLVGRIMARTKSPLQISCLQYGAVAIIAFCGVLAFETPTVSGFNEALPSLLYAGIASGGIAYTLQMIAQQYAPPSDTAVILSAESVFAAIGGYIFLHERISATGMAGCALIIAAILLVELAPHLRRKLLSPQP